MRFLRQLFRPNATNRRFLSALCGLYLLGTILFSSLFVIVEADHDCDGHDCPVCLQIQASLDFARQTGPLPVGDEVGPSAGPSVPERFSVRDYRAPATTLQSLYVRMDE